MHYGCDHRCPKVREQLRKARKQAGEEFDEGDSSSDSELSDASEPFKDQRTAKNASKRSKESSRYHSGAVSPKKIVRTPRRSYESTHKRDEAPPLHRGSFIRSPDASDRFEPNKRTHRRSQESGRKSPRSIRHVQREPNEYRSGTSSRTDSGDKIPHYVPTIKRVATEKPRYEKNQKRSHDRRDRRPFDDEATAGPSRMVRGVKAFADEFVDDENSSSARNICDPNCHGINKRVRKVKDEKQRKAMDESFVYKGLPYFGDLCTCCYKCLAEQLWNDNFVKSTVTSVALFAVGLILCSELDGWTFPNTFQ